jgi:predicted nucleic acid-binding protein
MPVNSTRGIMADTGFWIAAFDPREDHHHRAAKFLREIREHVLLMPWPITYEVLRTRTVRNMHMVASFGRILRGSSIHWVDDSSYRQNCLNLTLNAASSGKRAISLVDMIVRQIILERRFRITQLLTFNAGDFHDVCRANGVRLWPE